jgi:hypothetical protein
VEHDQDDHSGNNGYYEHEGQGHGESDSQNISGLDGVVGVDNDDFSDDEMGIIGGHATNLDGLDKDQIMKMID